jgi:hypothetical protein
LVEEEELMVEEWFLCGNKTEAAAGADGGGGVELKELA